MYIVFDLDRTLLNEKSEVTDYTLDVLKKCQAKGHKIIFDTARGYNFSLELLDIIKPDYAILDAGSLIIDKNHQEVYSKCIDKKTSNTLLKELGTIAPKISVDTFKDYYTNDPTYHRQNAIYIDLLQENDIEPLKIVAYVQDNEQLYALANKYNLEFSTYNSGFWHRLSPTGVNKWQGIVELCKHTGHDINDVITFGDDTGDLEMLLNASIGVAMKNSEPSVLEKVKIKTLSNDEDGVAVYLKELLLNE